MAVVTIDCGTDIIDGVIEVHNKAHTSKVADIRLSGVMCVHEICEAVTGVYGTLTINAYGRVTWASSTNDIRIAPGAAGPALAYALGDFDATGPLYSYISGQTNAYSARFWRCDGIGVDMQVPDYWGIPNGRVDVAQTLGGRTAWLQYGRMGTQKLTMFGIELKALKYQTNAETGPATLLRAADPLYAAPYMRVTIDGVAVGAWWLRAPIDAGAISRHIADWPYLYDVTLELSGVLP